MFQKGAIAALCVILLAARPSAADVLDKASIGASAGIMNFLTGDNYNETTPRGIGQVVFKYNFHPKWAAVLESGWGWADFPDPYEELEADTLVTVIPTTLGLEYRSRWKESSIWPHVAAGVGFYGLGVKDTYRSWAQAGDKVETLTWVSPGFYGKVGGEYLFDSGVAVNLDILYHAIISKDVSKYGYYYRAGDENDPERVNLSNTWGVTNTSFGQFRIGINYYFEPKATYRVPEGPEEGEEPEPMSEEPEEAPGK
jgi:hypothetical protein